jgi:hypothetical protein
VGIYVARSGRLPEPRPSLRPGSSTTTAPTTSSAPEAGLAASPPTAAAAPAINADAGSVAKGADTGAVILDAQAEKVVRLRRRNRAKRPDQPLPATLRLTRVKTDTPDQAFLRVAPTHAGTAQAADVYLDGHFFGEAPLDAPVPAGIHHLEVRREGFVSERQEVELRRGERLTVRVPLRALELNGAP